MPAGFFKGGMSAGKAPTYAIPRCGACGLYKRCQSPKMEPSGKGKRGILIVGEAPGATEDRDGIQFCGKSGELLQDLCRSVGLDMRRDCWLTNSIICWPGKGNPKPEDDKLAYCRPNLTKTIQQLNPRVIIPLGQRAVKQVLQGLWREDVGEMGRWVGWQIPARNPNAWICPNWHPSYLLRTTDNEITEFWFKRYLTAAVNAPGRPWAKPPADYAESVEIILDAREAARRIRNLLLLGPQPAAFDYETTMLKPDGPGADIVSCSISWGAVTIAYPWQGRAIDATIEFLESDAPKIASNMKFEDRWSRTILGVAPRNWNWDTMQAAHVEDNRPGISSIKFQALVRLGFPVYDEQIKPYLTADGTNKPNRIRELDLRKLCLYNGLDSLLEFRVAEIQKRNLGIESCTANQYRQNAEPDESRQSRKRRRLQAART